MLAPEQERGKYKEEESGGHSAVFHPGPSRLKRNRFGGRFGTAQSVQPFRLFAAKWALRDVSANAVPFFGRQILFAEKIGVHIYARGADGVGDLFLSSSGFVHVPLQLFQEL